MKPEPTVDTVETCTPPPPMVSVRIEDGSKPMNGKDIDLVIRLSCPSPRKLEVHMNAQGWHYNGTLESSICTEEKKVVLQAEKEMTIPFKIPFSKYGSHIQGNNAIKVSVIVHDTENPEEVYMADEDISPEDPPINIIISGEPLQYRSMQTEINFENPLSEALTNCTLTVTASGLFRRTAKATVAAVGPDQILRVLIPFMPYKHGEKRVVADFDCDQFRDIKASRNIIIKPYGSTLP
ncbi:hypothetical protein GJAV_G00181210 [Gymnothorax javanicus]|nr:hypothetical protein GJAV_G00181210 [Gymnothorax javanicus]